MGVPVFVRWLLERYGRDLLHAKDAITIDVDNFYIDLNGIIHPCTHGCTPKCANEDEMLINIMKYIDRLVEIAKPKHVLYLAVDGVAPRAKLNQQRSRRFISAQADAVGHETAEQFHDTYAKLFNLDKGDEKPWDKNVITPATPFMVRIANMLRYYVYNRLNTHPLWKNVRTTTLPHHLFKNQGLLTK